MAIIVIIIINALKIAALVGVVVLVCKFTGAHRKLAKIIGDTVSSFREGYNNSNYNNTTAGKFRYMLERIKLAYKGIFNFGRKSIENMSDITGAVNEKYENYSDRVNKKVSENDLSKVSEELRRPTYRTNSHSRVNGDLNFTNWHLSEKLLDFNSGGLYCEAFSTINNKETNVILAVNLPTNRSDIIDILISEGIVVDDMNKVYLDTAGNFKHIENLLVNTSSALNSKNIVADFKLEVQRIENQVDMYKKTHSVPEEDFNIYTNSTGNTGVKSTRTNIEDTLVKGTDVINESTLADTLTEESKFNMSIF